MPDTPINRLWNSAIPVPGTLAARHLRAHGLPATLPDIAFHPACKGRGTPSALPALLIAGRRAGQIVALERVFLHPDTAKPFLHDTVGDARFAAWQGGEPDRRVALAASFMAAASYMAATGKPCWSSLHGIPPQQVRFPEHVLEVTIVGSADDGEARALEAAREALHDSAYLTRMEMPETYPSWRDRLLPSTSYLRPLKRRKAGQSAEANRAHKGMFTTA